MSDGKKKVLDAALIQFFNSFEGTPTIHPPNVSNPFTLLPEFANASKEPHMSIARAWLEYTGVPAMAAGGLGALGINIGLQAGQVRTGTSLFAASRFGFGLALLLEASIGTAIFATVMTILDPEDLHAGGLTNEPIGKTVYEHLSPERLIIESQHTPSTWKHIWLSPSWQ